MPVKIWQTTHRQSLTGKRQRLTGKPSAKPEENDLHFQSTFGGGKLPAVEKGSTKCPGGGRLILYTSCKTDQRREEGGERREKLHVGGRRAQSLLCNHEGKEVFSCGRGNPPLPPPRPPGLRRRFSSSGKGGLASAPKAEAEAEACARSRGGARHLWPEG